MRERETLKWEVESRTNIFHLINKERENKKKNGFSRH